MVLFLLLIFLCIGRPFLSRRRVYPPFVDSLWNYKLCKGSSSASQFSSDEFHRNYKLHRPDTLVCVQKGSAEALKDTVSLGRDGWGRLEQRNAGLEQIRVSLRSPHHSHDRRGTLGTRDYSSECLYVSTKITGCREIFPWLLVRLEISLHDNQRDP